METDRFRQTNRQKNRQIDRQIETDRPKDIHTDIQTDTDIFRYTGKLSVIVASMKL